MRRWRASSALCKLSWSTTANTPIAIPRGANCSLISKAIIIVRGSTPPSATSLHSRQRQKPHNTRCPLFRGKVILGVGGLGGYAVQYAKLLGGGATIAAFDRNPDNLAIAKEDGADHIISIKGKSSADVVKELGKATGQSDLDAIIDCAGAPEMMQLGFSLLSISGHYADVGLVGDRIDIPLFPRVSREQTFHGSFWGNYNDLSEVMALAAQGKIRHTLKMFTFGQINEYIDLLRAGEVVGRAVMKF